MAVNYLGMSRKKWRDRGYLHLEGTESILRLPGGITKRNDLYGFVDMIAVPEDSGPFVYLQVTSRSNLSTRKRKIQRETTGKGQWTRPIREIARRILERGDRIVLEGWDQPKGAGTAWRDKEIDLTLEDLTDGED